MLDGVIENLHELDDSTEGAGAADTGNSAERAARLYARRGEALFAQLTGSFALVIVTRHSGEALLVRDRFGSRPLFYAATSKGWAWGSEIKCLSPLLDHRALDSEGLRQAIHYRYTVGDTLLQGVDQVLPACFVRLAIGKRPVEVRYWKLTFEPSVSGGDLDAWADRVDAGLDECMARLRSRYSSVGILLSGGVDSSMLALKAHRGGFRNCIAFTARWPGENPELEHAVAVARHIGIEHHIVDIDESRFEELLPRIVWRLEELPRHFNSLILAIIFEVASSRCDAVLHGASADVMIGPPDSVAIATFNRRRKLLGILPRPVRRALARRLPYNGNARVARLRSYLELDEHAYLQSLFAIEYGKARAPIKDWHFRPRGPSRRALEQFYEACDPATERMQRLDIYTFNQSHFAVLDRLSAPCGVPVALPFLSAEMVDIARQLPSQLKVTGEIAKPVLKRLMARSFPAGWVYRKKQGFPTHTTRWLAGPLRRWHRTLTEERTAARDLLSLRTLRVSDVEPYYEAVWTSMCLEIFCRQFIDGQGAPS
jgi:asparagine synthase (glutamine-hydrolysing)